MALPHLSSQTADDRSRSYQAGSFAMSRRAGGRGGALVASAAWFLWSNSSQCRGRMWGMPTCSMAALGFMTFLSVHRAGRIWGTSHLWSFLYVIAKWHRTNGLHIRINVRAIQYGLPLLWYHPIQCSMDLTYWLTWHNSGMLDWYHL